MNNRIHELEKEALEYRAKYYQALHELRKANVGLARLSRRLQRLRSKDVDTHYRQFRTDNGNGRKSKGFIGTTPVGDKLMVEGDDHGKSYLSHRYHP